MSREIITQNSIKNFQADLANLNREILTRYGNFDPAIIDGDQVVKNDLRQPIPGSENSFNYPRNEENLNVFLGRKAELEKKVTDGTDDYKDRLMKYIPVEVITFYLVIHGIVQDPSTSSNLYFQLGILILGIIATWLYLKRFGQVSNNFQLTLSCVAFIGWAVSLNEHIIPNHTIKALILPIVTFFIPLIDPGKTRKSLDTHK